jgi:hypothetical protein
MYLTGSSLSGIQIIPRQASFVPVCFPLCAICGVLKTDSLVYVVAGKEPVASCSGTVGGQTFQSGGDRVYLGTEKEMPTGHDSWVSHARQGNGSASTYIYVGCIDVV